MEKDLPTYQPYPGAINVINRGLSRWELALVWLGLILLIGAVIYYIVLFTSSGMPTHLAFQSNGQQDPVCSGNNSQQLNLEPYYIPGFDETSVNQK